MLFCLFNRLAALNIIIMKAYIYQIKNLENGKLYIGSTIGPDRRFYEHKYDLNKQAHHAEHLQKAWNKYGENSFEFSLLEETEIENRFKRERFWILTERTLNPDYGYNTVLPDENGGYYKTPEMKSKISQGVISKLIEQRGRVVLLNLETGEESYFNSVIEMKQLTGTPTVKKLSPSRKTYWFYEKSGIKIDRNKLLKKCLDTPSNTPKKVFAFNFLTEEFVGEFLSIESASKALGISVNFIGQVLGRVKKSAHNYTFNFENVFPEIQKHRKDKKHFGKRVRHYTKVEKNIKYKISNGKHTHFSCTVPELVNYVESSTKKGWQKLAAGERSTYLGYILERI